MKSIFYVTALATILALAACSAPASIADTEAEVTKFHRLLDAEDYGSIWRDTSEDMRGATSEADLSKIFEAVHRKLGKVVVSKQVGWRSNVTTGGTFSSVQMETKFEKGAGVESFNYRKVGKDLKLAGYNINSNDMMVN